MNCKRLFVEREREFTVQVWWARKARLTGCFIYARAWLADDYRGTNDETRPLPEGFMNGSAPIADVEIRIPFDQR
jgi:hypothetical protein